MKDETEDKVVDLPVDESPEETTPIQDLHKDGDLDEPIKTFSKETTEDDEIPFKTNNIKLEPEQSLDDLTKEEPRPVMSANPRLASQGPHIRPLGSRVSPVSGQKRGGGNRLIQFVALGVIGVIVLGVTVLLLKGGSLKSKTVETPKSPVVMESPSPEPTPAPELNRADITLRVLNGTTTAGLASTVATKLKDLGYKIEKTGNAPSQTVTQTQIRVKSASISAQLIKDLGPDYSASDSGLLKSSDTADGEVILGTK